MSLIYGVVNFDGEPVEEILAAMRQFYTSFPRDTAHESCDGGVGMGILQFHITPEDHREHQPRQKSALRFVFDGRVDYRDELSAELALEDASLTDSELALAAYEKWGDVMGNHVIGDYSLAVWDGKALRLITDSMGNRPMFWAKTTSGVAFSTHMGALKNLPGVDMAYDDYWIADYLAMTQYESFRSIHKGIRQVPQANCLTVTESSVKRRRYWEALKNLQPLKFDTPKEYHRYFGKVIEKSVTERLRGKSTFATLLSGGLDSSAVTGYLCSNLSSDQNVVACSSVLPENHQGPQQDERQYIRAVLDKYPVITWKPVVAKGRNMIESAPELFNVYGQPVRDMFFYRTHAQFTAAAAAGAKVVFTGVGGDLYASGRVRHPAYDIARSLGLAETVRYMKRSNQRSVRGFYKQIVRPVLALNKHLAFRYFKPLNTGHYAHSKQLIKTVGKRRIGEGQNVGQKLTIESQISWDDRMLATGPVLAISTLGSDHASRLKMTATNPLLDRKVIEALLAIPLHIRAADGQWRGLFKNSVRPILPELVYRRLAKEAFCPDWAARVVKSGDTTIKILRQNSDLAYAIDNEKCIKTLSRVSAEASGFAQPIFPALLVSAPALLNIYGDLSKE